MDDRLPARWRGAGAGERRGIYIYEYIQIYIVSQIDRYVFHINWLVKEATPTQATRKARRAVERERLCVYVTTASLTLVLENEEVRRRGSPYRCLDIDIYIYRQVGRQLNRQIDRQTDSQIDRYVDRQVDRQIVIQIARQLDTQIYGQLVRYIDM